ncbi:terminase small subunit [Hydrogenophaga sp.]|uniref:terminase small subunit n=1 Tax=Hydrogenophaga sp. TaxID=1904254 RepID=UPI003D0BE85B
MNPLTPKQQRFVQEYLVDLNATQAAVRAGYSPKTAEQQGSRLLGNAKVAAAVAAGRKRLAAKLDLTAEKVLADIERIANKAERAKRYGDALKGKELLGKHLKLFTEKHEHGGVGGGPVQFQITGSEVAH